jgi:hypothetical protein
LLVHGGSTDEPQHDDKRKERVDHPLKRDLFAARTLRNSADILDADVRFVLKVLEQIIERQRVAGRFPNDVFDKVLTVFDQQTAFIDESVGVLTDDIVVKRRDRDFLKLVEDTFESCGTFGGGRTYDCAGVGELENDGAADGGEGVEVVYSNKKRISLYKHLP